jgi:Protein of unknown function (DUF3634)
MPLAFALLLLLFTAPLVVALLRANELFYLRLHEGRIRIARGRIPQRLLDDIADVLRDPRVGAGTLRGVSEDGCVRLYAEADLTEGQRQRLRNVIGGWQVAQIRNAPRPRRPR